MNESFNNYTTSASFRLELSNPQIRVLSAAYLGFMAYNESHFLTIARALDKKGLVVYEPGVFEITTAGTFTVELLKEAGLYVEYDAEKWALNVA